MRTPNIGANILRRWDEMDDHGGLEVADLQRLAGDGFITSAELAARVDPQAPEEPQAPAVPF